MLRRYSKRSAQTRMPNSPMWYGLKKATRLLNCYARFAPTRCGSSGNGLIGEIEFWWLLAAIMPLSAR